MSRPASGMETTRLSAAEQDRIAREQREDGARRYLTGRGLLDVAEMLGLIPLACQSCGRRDATVRADGYCLSGDCRRAKQVAEVAR